MSFLEQITAARRSDASRRADDGAVEHARAAATEAAPPRDFRAALARDGMALIAEIKRASPSAGAINADIDPVGLACSYEAGGAAAISVLTEPDHFKGSLDDLRAISDAVDIPVLRKDFLVHPLHVWEARAHGADAVLLIVAALNQEELVSLAGIAEMLGMAVLVEVHDAAEMQRANDAEARIIGINTRDLATLTVDASVVAALRPRAREGALVVGESGVASRADVVALEQIGCDAVLVGEALMRAQDPKQKIRELLGTPTGT